MAVEFTTNLSGAIKDIDKKVRQAAEEIGQAAETHAKLYVTNGVYHSAEGWYRRTGNLRNNITHETQKESNGYSAVVGSPTKYAP